MVMSNKKKIVLMSGLVLLLAVTAVFNFVLAGANPSASTGGAVTASNYFTSYRTERTATRNEEILQLDSVIALYEAGTAEYEEAVDMKMEIVDGAGTRHRNDDQVARVFRLRRVRFHGFRQRERVHQLERTQLRYCPADL